jgi:hypothetical protein
VLENQQNPIEEQHLSGQLSPFTKAIGWVDGEGDREEDPTDEEKQGQVNRRMDPRRISLKPAQGESHRKETKKQMFLEPEKGGEKTQKCNHDKAVNLDGPDPGSYLVTDVNLLHGGQMPGAHCEATLREL